MLNLTKRQNNDLETIKFFIPDCLKKIIITDEDIVKFFEYSEKGLHKQDIVDRNMKDGFNALVEGKRWRGIHIHGMYEEGILDGSMPYLVILGGINLKEEIMPRSVVDFMKKEMFKGKDSDIIEECYQEILNYRAGLTKKT